MDTTKQSFAAGGSTATTALRADLFAERREVNNLTLPKAYRELGKDIYADKRFPKEFAELFARIGADLEKVEKLKQGQPVGPQEHATDMAEAVAARVENGFISLGKAAYEKHGTRSGPIELVMPITYDIVRVARLDGEIADIDQAESQPLFTAKHLAVGAGGVLFLVLVACAWFIFGTGQTGSRESGDTAVLSKGEDGDGASNDEQRLPFPEEEKLKEAAASVQKDFGDLIDSAKTPEAQKALSEKLVSAASTPDTPPERRYALLQTALKLAPDAATAISAIDEAEKAFRFDALRSKTATVGKFSKSAKTPEQQRAVADVASKLMAQASEADNYDAAMKLGNMAVAAAERAQEQDLAGDLRARLSRVHDSQQDYNKAQSALAGLRENPNDASANTAVGKYRCFVKRDWATGLPMLALGDDAVLKAIAARDLRNPIKSTQRAGLGDDWFNLATTAGGANKSAMLDRARYWYRLALRSEPPLPDQTRSRLEDRL